MKSFCELINICLYQPQQGYGFDDDRYGIGNNRFGDDNRDRRPNIYRDNENPSNGYQPQPPYNINPGDPYRNEGRFREEDDLRFQEQLRQEDANLRLLLTEIDERSSLECSLNVGAQWNFETNVNQATQNEAVIWQFSTLYTEHFPQSQS